MSECEIYGCTGSHRVAGPEWGEMAGTVIHRLHVPGWTDSWKMFTEDLPDPDLPLDEYGVQAGWWTE